MLRKFYFIHSDSIKHGCFYCYFGCCTAGAHLYEINMEMHLSCKKRRYSVLHSILSPIPPNIRAANSYFSVHHILHHTDETLVHKDTHTLTQDAGRRSHTYRSTYIVQPYHIMRYYHSIILYSVYEGAFASPK